MFFVRLCATLAIGCLAALILPSRFTEELGAQKIAKLAAPIEGYHYPVAQRDDITILLIDEPSLEVEHQSWPATFDYYVKLLEYVDTPANAPLRRSWHPKAVFFDIVFEHEQDKARLLAFETALDAIDAASQARRKAHGQSGSGRPVVFLAARLQEHKDLHINEDLDAYPGATEVAIEYAPSEVDRIAWTYRLFLDEHGVAPPRDHADIRHASTQARASDAALPPERRSAALSIYEDAYGLARPTPYRYVSPTMMLTWGLDTAEYGLRWKVEEDDEEDRKDAWWSADGEHSNDPMYCTSDENDNVLLKRAEARSIMRSLSRPLCVFHRTIHASQLRDMTSGELKAAFDDKVVMIGTSLRYSNDIVVSPLHDRIPGVFLHAMALDNLLTSKGNHYQEYWEPPQSPFNEHWPAFAALCVIGLAPVALVRGLKEVARNAYRQWRQPRPGGRPKPLGGLWWRRKALDATFKCLLFVISGLLLVYCAIKLLVWGQTWMHVPFLAVSHLVACAMTVEWFDWGSDFVNWILDVRE
ncbi:CHASE2 domain-containing protein [Caballeronia sp. LZ043]|uniref:CHASE2 domain-containing protein n=1 Tax=Caballeronia sp. LZ043 TaxID=3038569 RepID=UPI0028614317|nr:CHASE2 domain-containing protein [Caballeronia sp. LZ043]MDR5822171.1 CHASE2 domain-containing protein [Caballeronia sp. LZ043]